MRFEPNQQATLLARSTLIDRPVGEDDRYGRPITVLRKVMERSSQSEPRDHRRIPTGVDQFLWCTLERADGTLTTSKFTMLKSYANGPVAHRSFAVTT